MNFTIVTPSYRQLDLLACCIASVADQEGIHVEHIVQDAGTEGFADFLEKMKRRWPDRPGYRRVMVSEPDGGMYDAINRGLKKGTGEVCAYLNCDEQYLPGALRVVWQEMEKVPDAQLLYAGFVVVDAAGRMVTLQQPVSLFWPHVATSHLPNFSCATFFRRSLLNREKAWFNPSYRACGDAAWTLERLHAKTPSIRISRFISVFRETGDHQGLSPQGLAERAKIRSAQPVWVRWGAVLWKSLHRLNKLASGGYRLRTLRYDVWQKNSDATRTSYGPFIGTGIWRSRLHL